MCYAFMVVLFMAEAKTVKQQWNCSLITGEYAINGINSIMKWRIYMQSTK